MTILLSIDQLVGLNSFSTSFISWDFWVGSEFYKFAIIEALIADSDHLIAGAQARLDLRLVIVHTHDLNGATTGNGMFSGLVNRINYFFIIDILYDVNRHNQRIVGGFKNNLNH